MEQKACEELDGNSDETTVTPNGKKRSIQQIFEMTHATDQKRWRELITVWCHKLKQIWTQTGEKARGEINANNTCLRFSNINHLLRWTRDVVMVAFTS
ncbi:hypothetical protein QTP70_026753 [Hemibagrus guttatus]|uniref:Uncharacterized protein n=1 Tax=Hemibagrus guttatus TaxID=175788 RepID=A0AAE0PXT4_9TELE|nr:hypothetical protein QTP70_026753 [Hemibagrus guttatus]